MPSGDSTASAIPQRDDESLAGTIQHITLQNWMAYTGPVTLYPSSGLNIIAASNGSGKSAIVCAIALGLGYSPAAVSRGDTPSVFVKRGFSWAKLEIGINKRGGSTMLVTRRIDVGKDGDSTSTWLIDGEKVTNSFVTETITKMNIRLDNLISFLPQENVSKFTSMTPKQLLIATLRGIKPLLLDRQNDIDKLDKDVESFDSRIKANLKQLSMLKGEIDLLERKEREYAQLGEEKIKLSILNHILLLMHVEDITSRIDDNRKKIVQYESEIANLRLKLEPLNVLKNKILQAHQKYDEQACETEKVINNIITQLFKPNSLFSSSIHFEGYNNVLTLKNKLEGDELKKKEIQQRIDELAKIESENKKEIQLLRSKISESECKFHQLSSMLAEKKVELDNLIKKSRCNNDKYGRFDKKQNLLGGRTRRMKLSDSAFQLDSFQRMQLENLYKTIHPKSIENVDKFLHVQHTHPNVLGPIAALVQLCTPHASILECAIKNYLDAFVAPNILDVVENISSKYNISIVTTPGKNISLCHVTEEIRAWGVELFLHETFQAPEQVKQTLSNVARINQSFIVTDSSKLNDSNFSQFYEVMIREISIQVGRKVKVLEFFMDGMRRFYTQLGGNSFVDEQTPYPAKPNVLILPEATDNLKISELNGNIELIKEELNNNSYRTDSIKLQRLELASKKIERDLPGLLARLESLRVCNLKEEVRDLLDKTRQSVQQDIAQHLDRLTAAADEIDEVVAGVGALKKLVAKMNYLKKLLSQLGNRLNPLTERFEANEKLIQDANKLIIELASKKEQFEAQLEESKQTLKRTLVNTVNIKYKAERRGGEEDAVARAAERVFLGEDVDEVVSDLVNDYHRQYREKQEVCKQVQISRVRIQHLSSIIDAASGYAQITQMMDSLEAKRCQFASLEEQVKMDELDKIELVAKRDEYTQQWVDEVKEIVSKVDTQFSRLMGLVKEGVMGQARLVNNEKVGDAELSIRVRFSGDKDLLPLSTSYQSGGERGVVTMLYILSLQHYTFSPFYLLDEINQGLDVDYERALLCIIQSNLKKNSQLFIITPHLIPGLDLSKATMHFPFNGPFVTDNNQGWAIADC